MDRLLALAGAAADQAEVYRVEQRSDVVEFHDGRLHDIEGTRRTGTSLRILGGGRAGFAYTRNLTDPAALVSHASVSLAVGPEAAYDFPATADLPVLPTDDPAFGETTNADLVAECARIRDRLRGRTDAEILVRGETSRNRVRLASTAGTDLETAVSRHTQTAALIHPGSGSEVVRQQLNRRFTPLADELLEEMIRIFDGSRREVRPAGGRMPVLFMPNSLPTLLYRIWSGTSARSLVQGISPLADRVGERVLSDLLTFVDDPRDPEAAFPRPFDDEGVACDLFPVFESGIFRGFHNDLDHASRLGVAPTGHGVRVGLWSDDPVTQRPVPGLRHGTIQLGTDGLDELVGRMDRGLVLEGQMGAHSGNVAHGDYSVGVNPGLWVENGEIVGRVKDAMVSGNVYETLRNVIAIGRRRDHVTRGRFPPILCDDVRVVCG